MNISIGADISSKSKPRLILATLAMTLLVGCDEAGNFNIGQVFEPKPEGEIAQAGEEVEEFIERDVESPDVFQAAEAGLWDGRPSLGGVWVAHPDVKDPERVMIRNKSNGKFVVGALFRREREIPGPRLQISSDAAVALDVLAGAPVELEVVALRKEKVPVPRAEPPAEAASEPIEPPAEVEETALDPIAAAGAAIDSADPTPVEAAAEQSQAPVVQSTLPVSRLEKPYIQVGIFNQSANAEVAADQMRAAGMIPTVVKQESNGKAFWRVIVGPAGTTSERSALTDKIKNVGYTDAYPVTN